MSDFLERLKLASDNRWLQDRIISNDEILWDDIDALIEEVERPQARVANSEVEK